VAGGAGRRSGTDSRDPQCRHGDAYAIRQIGVSEVTYYRWRQEFGGLKTEQVKRLKDLELENSRAMDQNRCCRGRKKALVGTGHELGQIGPALDVW
jgi:Transposase